LKALRVLAASVALLACSKADGTARRYQDPQGRFELLRPSSWAQDLSPQGDAVAFLEPPRRGRPGAAIGLRYDGPQSPDRSAEEYAAFRGLEDRAAPPARASALGGPAALELSLNRRESRVHQTAEDVSERLVIIPLRAGFLVASRLCAARDAGRGDEVFERVVRSLHIAADALP